MYSSSSSPSFWDELHFFIPPTLYSSIPTFNTFLILLLLLSFSLFFLPQGGFPWALSSITTHTIPSIPGPSGFPILGLVFTFTGSLTHRALRKLAHAFSAAPLMAFSVGFTRFVVASEPETAKELLNSCAFGDRPVKESAYELMFHRAMGFAPAGEYWRNLRRIAATRFFNGRRVAEEGGKREKEGVKMVGFVKDLMEKNGEVKVRKVLHFGSLRNVVGNVFGIVFESGCEEEEYYKTVDGLVEEGYELLGLFNWSDHFPILRLLDLQGVRRRCSQLASKVNVFVGGIIEQKRNERRRKRRRLGSDGGDGDLCFPDFVHVLLDLEKENRLTQSDMIAVLWEMVFRGTDTVAILLEWAIARMVAHPEIQEKLQKEIYSCVGKTRVKDEDIVSMPYLKAVVKETLRLHPPGPLLSWARLTRHNTTLGGHFIPAGTTAMVNMWAITHDEKIWKNAYEFKPERFIEEDVSVMGSDLRLAPFGAGRRVCPGRAMAMATTELWLAQMVQSFRWVAVEGKGVDLRECLKMSMEMKNPLVCSAVEREV